MVKQIGCLNNNQSKKYKIMSGGNWDYFHIRFSSEIEEFCNDIKERFPELAEKLQATGKTLCEIIGEIDYDGCDDAHIKSDKEFEHESIEKIKKAIGK